MKSYEAIREIFNQCPNNQRRDNFIEEIETDDLDAYIREKFKDREFSCEKTIHADGSVVYEIMTAGIHQRYTFSEI